MFQKLFPPFVADEETGVPPNIYLGIALALAFLGPLAVDLLL